jgi:hypothetical protein
LGAIIYRFVLCFADLLALSNQCLVSFFLAAGRVTSAEVSEDSSLLAVGFTDSIIKIWTLVPQKLRAMKSAEQLQDIDREAGKDLLNEDYSLLG